MGMMIYLVNNLQQKSFHLNPVAIQETRRMVQYRVVMHEELVPNHAVGAREFQHTALEDLFLASP